MKEMLAIGLLGGLLISTGTVKADQLIFSQYDGVNTWNNVYVEVEDASIYEGAFIDGVPGSSWDSVVAVAGVEGKEAVINKVEATPKTRVYNHRTLNRTIRFRLINGEWKRTGNNRSFKIYHRNCSKGMGCRNRSLDRIIDATYNNVVIEEAVEEVEAVAGRQGGHEDPQVRRTIVSVPTGVDIDEFIKDYMS